MKLLRSMRWSGDDSLNPIPTRAEHRHPSDRKGMERYGKSTAPCHPCACRWEDRVPRCSTQRKIGLKDFRPTKNADFWPATCRIFRGCDQQLGSMGLSTKVGETEGIQNWRNLGWSSNHLVLRGEKLAGEREDRDRRNVPHRKVCCKSAGYKLLSKDLQNASNFSVSCVSQGCLTNMSVKSGCRLYVIKCCWWRDSAYPRTLSLLRTLGFKRVLQK